jgi:membrane protein implicated in regulation of membrane protease activity
MRTRSHSAAWSLLGLLLAGVALPVRAEPEPFGRLDVDQVEALLGRKGVVIFDVNSAETYAKGHVPGAIWTALGDVARNLPADRSLQLIYYCHSTT